MTAGGRDWSRLLNEEGVPGRTYTVRALDTCL